MPPSHRDGTREGARTLALLERLRLAASTGIKRSGIESVPLARLSAVLSLFVVGDLVLMRACHIPGDAYTHPVIAVALARHLFSLGPASIAVLFGLVLLIGAGLWRRSFGPTWDALDGGRRLRALCLVTCLILTWAYATYAFNYVAGQGHLVDRLLLILLIPLVWWRPAFLVPYLLVLLPVIWQFDAPIGGFSWSEPALLTRLLILVGAAYAVQTLAGRLRTGD
ncbi:MAG TPA: hypothetical protein VF190_15590, partial [Rhodothermales bacterium]